MSPNADADASMFAQDRQPTLLVLVPGVGIQAEDFHARNMVAEVERRGWTVTVTVIDPGPDAYLDGSVETSLLGGIESARAATGPSRIWLAGISLGCQGILRCVRQRPGLADGLLLLTPYLASTGLVAEATRSGGLRPWALSDPMSNTPERAFLSWLGTTPVAALPRMMVGQAEGDRFAASATLLAALIPMDHLITTPGQHDWESWLALWRRMLDRDPFGQQAAVAQ